MALRSICDALAMRQTGDMPDLHLVPDPDPEPSAYNDLTASIEEGQALAEKLAAEHGGNFLDQLLEGEISVDELLGTQEDPQP